MRIHLYKKLYRGFRLSIQILSGAILFSPGGHADSSRPMIWVKASDRQAILEKIENQDWASRLYSELKSRADEALDMYEPDPEAYLLGLPFEGKFEETDHPSLLRIDKDPGGSPSMEARKEIMTRLQQAIDCGVLYYLTEDKRYAQFAADVLAAYIRGVQGMKPNPVHNGGLIYITDHLKEARIFGAQIPIIYDFASPFLRHGGKALNLATSQREPFPFEAAQKVFRTYIDMALTVGIIDCNWPVLESPSLVNNILALDDPKAREKLLPYYLTVDTPNQDSLRKVAETYREAGGIWPESPLYAIGVGQFTGYLMTLLERWDPSLKLGEKYPEPAQSLIRMEYLRFPNQDFMTFGDSRRSLERKFHAFENAYHLARLGGHEKEADKYGGILKQDIESGTYDRGNLRSRSFAAGPYFVPLQLLWQEPEIEGDFVMSELPRTDELKFAGIYLQRNLVEEKMEENSLMSFLGAGHYVHAHVTGLHMELYGKGEVLGLRGGKAIYNSYIHENYYVLFASGNTVISNGASASSGGWVDRYMHQAELVSMEPMAQAQAVSPNHSFTTVDFFDEYNLVAPAEHRRTMALIRTSPETGYYVDIFRARSEGKDQFHDYIYHNVGESLNWETSGSDSLKFIEDAQRYPIASPPRGPNQKYHYNHPGWHVFEDIQTANTGDNSLRGEFTANGFENGPLKMWVHLPYLGERELTNTLAPPSLSSHGIYKEKKTPTFVIRQKGEAWDRPFAAVYEPGIGDQTMGSVKTVKAILQNDEFHGLRVESEIEGKALTQYVLILEPDQHYENKDLQLSFEGHFAIVSIHEEGRSGSLYLGDGKNLIFQNQQIAGGRGYLEWKE